MSMIPYGHQGISEADIQATVDVPRAADIGVILHYIPVHTQPYYEELGFQAGQCPEAEQYYSEAINLPMYPVLTKEQQFQLTHLLDKAARV